ncbi:MAG: GNAT family N-acetyltransferase [Henriciella sp.]|nr:GNAT family N-acetyltransferase [Henriciella sp.]
MIFRDAIRDDLPAIVQMLADDRLGATRETFADPLPDAYATAFDDICDQTGNRLIVAVDEYDRVSACLQLTFIPGIARRGMKRGLIEGVRVRRDLRGTNIGTRLFEYAIEAARTAGCGLVQLTTDKQRPDAHSFYEKLGFEASHTGMKLIL